MTENVALWIFGVINGTLALLVVAGFKSYSDLAARVVRLETTIELLGKNAIKLLHSPDDHLHIDVLIDKYVAGHFDLPLNDWETLYDHLVTIVHDTARTKVERTLALLGTAHCVHKLSRYGKRVALPELELDTDFLAKKKTNP